MRHTAEQIAAMIDANVKAVDAGKITWKQFSVVNSATWDLASRNERLIYGSKAHKRVIAVQAALRTIR